MSLTSLVNSSGYTGTFLSPFYSPLLISALKGAYVFVQFAGFEADSPGIKTMNDTIDKFKPGTKPSLALAAGYFSADQFIAAVKASLKTSKTLTSASVQKAASKMTYQVKDTVGPTLVPGLVQVRGEVVRDAARTTQTARRSTSCSRTCAPRRPIRSCRSSRTDRD